MPTLIYCDGFEHRTISANDLGGVDGVGIFDVVTDTGANAVIVTTGQRTGNAALELSPDGTTVSLAKLIPGADPAVSVVSVYIKFTTLPTVDSKILIFSVAAGTNSTLLFNAATGKFRLGLAGGSADFGPVLTTGVYYRVDLRADVSANPSLFDGQVDGGTNVQASLAQAATTITQWVFGQDGQTTVWTATYDDFVASNTSVDYPIGAHRVLGLFPNGDGTHNFTPAGDFLKNAGTSMDPADTDGWLSIDDWITGPADTTTRIADALGASTEYTEHTFDDTTETTVWLEYGFVGLAAANAAANNATSRIVDSAGATVVDIFAGDQSEAAVHFRSALVRTNPTQAQVNGDKFRYGFATDVNPDPWCTAVMLQIAVPEAAAQTFFVTVGGAITAAGSLIQEARKLLAGSQTPAGALGLQDQKALAGSVGPSGALLKQAQKPLGGAVTPSGALSNSKVILLSVAGAISPSGALTRLVGKALAGQQTPSGVLSRLVGAILAGAIAPSGVLAREVRRVLAGALSPGGVLTKTPGKLLSEAQAPSGALSKTPGKALAGSVAPAGSLTRTVSKVLSGLVAPSGSLAKLVARTFAGAITAVGTVTNVVTLPPQPFDWAVGPLSIKSDAHTLEVKWRGKDVRTKWRGGPLG